MALSRSMKNLMHDAAQARRGGGNPGRPGPEAPSGPIAGRSRSQRLGKTQPNLSGMAEAIKGRGTRYDPAEDPARRGGGVMNKIAVPGGRMPRGGVMGGPAGGVGKPRPGAGTFGFASRGGGRGTPALQKATSGARSQVQAMRQRAAPPGGTPAARARGPAALAQPRGQSVASRIGGTQGPPARRGGMARALGSGGSRRRMLR